NNIICCEEKEIFVHQNIYDQFLRSLKQLPVIILAEHQTDKLMKRVFTDGHPDKRFIGKNASVLLAEIGVQAGDEIRLIISEVDEDHPLVHTEQLMPFLPLVKVRSTEAGIAQAYQAENGRFHSAYMHSQNISHLHAMARKMNTAIFVKNAPSLAGLGYETGMYTSFTIAGCTGEGLTTARTFTRERLCVLKGYFHIV
ncbi:MAG TPA: aldehyde dehydrogenase EutE, partial [Spirochaetia bacterium]|nr:aldehyde dehydrogenase EutE [Spirochaetia bacterium]